MADFRSVLAGLGCTDVTTYLQSGNAAFRTNSRGPKALETEIGTALKAELGLDVGCIVRAHADLARVVKGNPFPAAVEEPKRLAVVFLSGKVKPELMHDIDSAKHAPDEFAAGATEVYVWYRRGVNESKLTHALFQKALDVPVATGRNWNTVTALADLTA
jgi:uncharacterized protein (DUF1697 family)